MLRWTSPVTHMAREATVETVIRGRHIRAGDMVVMLYGSGNRDEETFGSDADHS
ncbi:cytochrome P450 [Mycobacterium sp. URHB0021]|jgi:cytochrome P450